MSVEERDQLIYLEVTYQEQGSAEYLIKSNKYIQESQEIAGKQLISVLYFESDNCYHPLDFCLENKPITGKAAEEKDNLKILRTHMSYQYIFSQIQTTIVLPKSIALKLIEVWTEEGMKHNTRTLFSSIRELHEYLQDKFSGDKNNLLQIVE